MAVNPESRQHALNLIRELRDATLADSVANVRLEELERLLGYPRVSDLIFYHDPELTDSQIIEKALEYKPFAL